MVPTDVRGPHKAKRAQGSARWFARAGLAGLARNPVPVAIGLLCASSSQAAVWTFEPRVGLRETYTDNVALAPEGQKQSDWVTELTPALGLRARGPSLRLDALYSPHILDYRNVNGASRVLQEGAVAGTAKLVDKLLYVDASGSITQQNILSFAPQSVDIINTTGNRAEVRSGRISPFLRHDFGDAATGELRYTMQRLRTGDAGNLDANSSSIYADISSGRRFQILGWGATAEQQKVEYLGAFPVHFRRYTARLRYAISPQLAASVTGGYENNDFPVVNGDSNGSIGAVALTWTPSAATAVSASAGRRFFGPTYSVIARRSTPGMTITFGYNEDVTTLAGIGTTGTFETIRFLNSMAAARTFTRDGERLATLPSDPWNPARPASRFGFGALSDEMQDEADCLEPLPAAPGAPQLPAGTKLPGEAPTDPLNPASGANANAQGQGQGQGQGQAQGQVRGQDRRDAMAGAATVDPAGRPLLPECVNRGPRTAFGANPTQVTNVNPLTGTAIPGAPVIQEMLDPFAPGVGLPAGASGNVWGLSNRVYLQKLMQASVEFISARNRFLVLAYGARREPLSAPVGAPTLPSTIPGVVLDDRTRQIGVGAVWTRLLSERTTFTVDASAWRTQSEIDSRVDHDRSLRLILARQLQPTVNATLEVRRQQRNSSVGGDFRENAVSAFVVKRF